VSIMGLDTVPKNLLPAWKTNPVGEDVPKPAGTVRTILLAAVGGGALLMGVIAGALLVYKVMSRRDSAAAAATAPLGGVLAADGTTVRRSSEDMESPGAPGQSLRLNLSFGNQRRVTDEEATTPRAVAEVEPRSTSSILLASQMDPVGRRPRVRLQSPPSSEQLQQQAQQSQQQQPGGRSQHSQQQQQQLAQTVPLVARSRLLGGGPALRAPPPLRAVEVPQGPASSSGSLIGAIDSPGPASAVGPHRGRRKSLLRPWGNGFDDPNCPALSLPSPGNLPLAAYTRGRLARSDSIEPNITAVLGDEWQGGDEDDEEGLSKALPRSKFGLRKGKR
jgi:hypothetical protein